ncbi:hypothetical protein G6F57_013899 [Rhizopus arrhizus]|nr:hypothetical protein G6F57_013899 [Rhizopus arrhizus]
MPRTLWRCARGCTARDRSHCRAAAVAAARTGGRAAAGGRLRRRGTVLRRLQLQGLGGRHLLHVQCRAAQIGGAQVQLAKLGVGQVAISEIGAVPVDALELATGQVRARETGAAHIGAVPAVLPQLALFQRHPREIGVAQVRLLDEAAAEPTARGDLVHEAGVAEVRALRAAFADLQAQCLDEVEVAHADVTATEAGFLQRGAVEAATAAAVGVVEAAVDELGRGQVRAGKIALLELLVDHFLAGVLVGADEQLVVNGGGLQGFHARERGHDAGQATYSQPRQRRGTLFRMLHVNARSCMIPGMSSDPSPLPAQRTQQILEELRQQGRVVAADLARRYAVSEDSIRRDLRELAAQGLCQRVYGGAVLPPPKERPLRERLTRDRGDKAELAARVCALLQPGQRKPLIFQRCPEWPSCHCVQQCQRFLDPGFARQSWHHRMHAARQYGRQIAAITLSPQHPERL